ncbi:MAG: hypothetical protein D6781_01010, partial [Verrucomicrobia bacterium]
LEDQDFWRLSGIFRDVLLIHRPASFLRDAKITADFDPRRRTGILRFEGELDTPPGHAAATVDLELRTPDGATVWRQSPGSDLVSDPVEIPDCRPWSAETPDLYTLLVRLSDRDGKPLEIVPFRIGFRRVEIAGGRLLVNGVAVTLRGVNRHEHDPDTGHTVDRASMLRDIQLLKANNFNAVRTSHYPNHPLWYALCDAYGIYLIDEGNIETHGMGRRSFNALANDPVWREAHLDRLRRMVLRDRNHPSVIIWSYGNESGDGSVFAELYKWIKSVDPSRPVHYENATLLGNYAVSDINSRMYPSVDDIPGIIAEQPQMPFLACEYAHAMGNSCGNLAEYWALIDADNNFQGAFVWDWVDQGIRAPVPAGYRRPAGPQTFFAYGGWFENPHGIRHDDNFCMNGLVAADRTPRPPLRALKYHQRPIQVAAEDLAAGRFLLRNRLDFTRADGAFTAHWRILADGRPVHTASLDLPPLPPHGEAPIELAYPDLKRWAGSELFVQFAFNRAGHFIADPFADPAAWDEFPLAPFQPETPASPAAAPELLEETRFYTIIGDNTAVRIDRFLGTIVDYTLHDRRLIETGIAPNFWRASTDNDLGAWKNNHDAYRASPAIWREAARRANVEVALISRDDHGAVHIRVAADLPAVEGRHTLDYRIRRDGSIEVTSTYHAGEKPLPMLPRFGVDLVLAAGLEEVEWYGTGPESSYIDRSVGLKGVYRSRVSDLWVPYARPQENGYRHDARWVTFTDSAGTGLRITAEAPFGFGAHHFPREEIERAAYDFQLTPHPQTFLALDAFQMGVGGTTSWGPKAYPLTKYRFPNRDYTFSFRITPVSPQ